MTQTPNEPNAPTQIDHNIRIVQFTTGDHVVANFAQVKDPEDETRIVAYQLLFPLLLGLVENGTDDNDQTQYNITYRRWNPYTPYEDHRVQINSVISAMPPAQDILVNYVNKLKEAGVDLSFLPNNGNDILGITDGEPKEPTSAATEGPVATGTSGGN